MQHPQLSLFEAPVAPAHAAPDPRVAAARAIQAEAYTVRLKALDAIRRRPMTADQVAEALGLSILTVRPRVTELAKDGLIEDAGFRAQNASGKWATAWRAK